MPFLPLCNRPQQVILIGVLLLSASFTISSTTHTPIVSLYIISFFETTLSLQNLYMRSESRSRIISLSVLLRNCALYARRLSTLLTVAARYSKPASIRLPERLMSILSSRIAGQAIQSVFHTVQRSPSYPGGLPYGQNAPRDCQSALRGYQSALRDYQDAFPYDPADLPLCRDDFPLYQDALLHFQDESLRFKTHFYILKTHFYIFKTVVYFFKMSFYIVESAVQWLKF